MKQILLSFLLLSFTTAATAQYADTARYSLPTNYLQKSKNQKTAAWILLVGGALMTTIGAVVAVNELEDILYDVNIFDPNPPPANDDGTFGAVLAIGGLAAMVGSIPLFIAAGKNRRKAAASVSFKMENATNIYKCAVSKSLYPAVAIHFRL